MKKSRQRNGGAPKGRQAGDRTKARKAPASRTRSRRETLRLIRDWGLVAAAVGFGGWWLVDDVRADMAERDLSRVGAGAPTVVQIHDPQCPICRALQRETREAMAGFSDAELLYLVADIRSPEGRALADRHGVQHVTLVLFDGAGNRRRTLTGMREAPELRAAFQRHVSSDRGS